MKNTTRKIKDLSPENAAINKSLREATTYARKLAKQTNTRFVVRKTKPKKTARMDK
jgi:hypothetical protein